MLSEAFPASVVPGVPGSHNCLTLTVPASSPTGLTGFPAPATGGQCSADARQAWPQPEAAERWGHQRLTLLSFYPYAPQCWGFAIPPGTLHSPFAGLLASAAHLCPLCTGLPQLPSLTSIFITFPFFHRIPPFLKNIQELLIVSILTPNNSFGVSFVY